MFYNEDDGAVFVSLFVTADSSVWQGEMQVLVTEVFTKNQAPRKDT